MTDSAPIENSEASIRNGASESHAEPVRKCQYCKEKVKSRGLFAHVMNTSGDGHGDYREIPDDFSHSGSPIVGEEQITVEEKSITNSESGKEAIFCLICQQKYKGSRGFHNHMTKMAGKNGHPERDEKITQEMFKVVPADDNYNPLYSPESQSEPDMAPSSGVTIPFDKLLELNRTIIKGTRNEAVDVLDKIVKEYS